MHILATQSGVIGDSVEPVDLAQEPGDIIVISAADSELAALARAHDGLAGLNQGTPGVIGSTCFETRPSGAPQHEASVPSTLNPHPEEARSAVSKGVRLGQTRWL